MSCTMKPAHIATGRCYGIYIDNTSLVSLLPRRFVERDAVSELLPQWRRSATFYMGTSVIYRDDKKRWRRRRMKRRVSRCSTPILPTCAALCVYVHVFFTVSLHSSALRARCAAAAAAAS